VTELEGRIADLKRQEQSLKRQVEALQANYIRTLQNQAAETQNIMQRLAQDSLADLEQRKQALQLSIEQLERRQERIKAEMRSNFAGVSQELAVRVQGFKDYLVGSLQDLATAAEQLQLTPATTNTPAVAPARNATPEKSRDEKPDTTQPKFAQDRFEDDVALIRELLNQYRTQPDYYGPPWQLRRTFEPIHAERVSKWFFEQGGRGALRSMGSRLQNILVASAVISILVELYGDRPRALVLANTPERLGEWRRGLQDCLGISRGDFGAEQGIVLFEAAEPLAQRAERLLQKGLLPIIIIDESEDNVSLSVLQFPLWLAFAPDPSRPMVV
jgi:hypothetical protein